MAYRQVINQFAGLSVSDKIALQREFDTLRAELDNIRTKYAAVLAKLDADAGVTDTNYTSLHSLSAAQFNATT